MAQVFIGKTKIGETRKIDYGDERNPQWNERFRGDVAHESKRLDIQVRNTTHVFFIYLFIVVISVKIVDFLF